MSHLIPHACPSLNITKLLNTSQLTLSAQVPPTQHHTGTVFLSSSVITPTSASLIQTSPLCICTSPLHPPLLSRMQCQQLHLQSQDTTQGNRSHSCGPGVLPGVLLVLGGRHLHATATRMTSSHPSPTAPSPLHHHAQPEGPRSSLMGVPHLRIL